MTNTFTSYLLWALAQHTLIILSSWLIPTDVEINILLSVVLFTLAHFPNWQLMIVTFFASLITYFIFGVVFLREGWGALFIMPMFIVAHALIGRFLVKRGMEMRVLWMHPLWKKWFNK
jgi:hypothetical protein